MTQPLQSASVMGRNPVTAVLGLIAGVVIIVGGTLLDWLSGSPSKALDTGIEIFWSVTPAAEPSFFASAGFAVMAIGAITLIGAGTARGGLVVFGGMLAVTAFVLVIVSFYRVELANLGIGDAGVGLWAILAGGVLAFTAGAMSRRTLG